MILCKNLAKFVNWKSSHKNWMATIYIQVIDDDLWKIVARKRLVLLKDYMQGCFFTY